jgi:hypothetical protein
MMGLTLGMVLTQPYSGTDRSKLAHAESEHDPSVAYEPRRKDIVTYISHEMWRFKDGRRCSR